MIFRIAFHTSHSYESVAGCSLLKCYRYDSFAKIVQTEWNSKYIADYFEIPEETPIFATKVKYKNSIPLLTCKHAPFCLINKI